MRNRDIKSKEVFPLDAKIVVRKALENKLVVPAFNIPHLPMVKPIVQAVVDENSVAMIQVARLEWEKFESESLERVAEEYEKYKKEGHTLLHLDHVPVIDEDHLEVDYLPIIERAIKAGYQSVMVDASRLSLEGNIAATKAVCDIAPTPRASPWRPNWARSWATRRRRPPFPMRKSLKRRWASPPWRTPRSLSKAAAATG